MVKIRGQVKKIISIALGIILFSTQGSSAAVSKTPEPQLTLKAALEQAFKSNKTLMTTKNQWQSKTLEIESLQAKLDTLVKSQEGLNLEGLEKLATEEAKATDEAKAADEAMKKAYSERVALISALNQKQEELKALKWTYESAINTMTYNVKVLYYDLLENTEAYAYEVENANQLEETYIKLYPQYLQGLVKTEVIKANRENYKSSQERQTKTLLAIDQLKAKLTTQLGGIDIGSWTYDGNLPDYIISEEVLSQLYPYAVHHDVQLLTLEKNLNTAQCLLEEMNDIYLQAYGEQGKWIFPTIHERQVDYPLLFENNQNMVASKPKGDIKYVYPLRYGFFKVNTLGDYYKDLPMALSLMAEASPLTEALSQREEKRGLVTEGYTTLQKNYRAAYEAYKQLEFDLEALRESLITDTAILEKLKKDNLQGKISYYEVQTLMLKVSDAKRRERVLHIKLNKSIGEIDFVSAGAVRTLAKLEGFEQVGGGLATEENTSPQANPLKVDEEVFWQVENPGDYYGFAFTLSAPTALKATHYLLFDPEGKALSEPVAIGTRFQHSNLQYVKGASLKLVLYQKDKVLKTTILSGDKISGRF